MCGIIFANYSLKMRSTDVHVHNMPGRLLIKCTHVYISVCGRFVTREKPITWWFIGPGQWILRNAYYSIHVYCILYIVYMRAVDAGIENSLIVIYYLEDDSTLVLKKNTSAPVTLLYFIYFTFYLSFTFSWIIYLSYLSLILYPLLESSSLSTQNDTQVYMYIMIIPFVFSPWRLDVNFAGALTNRSMHHCHREEKKKKK